MSNRRVLSIIALSCLIIGIGGCGMLGSSASRELALYKESDDPKPLASFLHSEEGYTEKDLKVLIEWSLDNRWQFLKFVDHLKGRKRSDFMTSFPPVLVKSEYYEDFRARYAASPSRSIRSLLESAETLSAAP